MVSIANAVKIDEDRIRLPAGLTWDRVAAAVKVIEDWELYADATATELAINLYVVLCSP